MNSSKKNRYIFSQKLAGLLMLHGFYLKEMRPDKQNSTKNVFIFNDSEELKKVLNEFNRTELEVLYDYNRKSRNTCRY